MWFREAFSECVWLDTDLAAVVISSNPNRSARVITIQTASTHNRPSARPSAIADSTPAVVDDVRRTNQSRAVGVVTKEPTCTRVFLGSAGGSPATRAAPPA
jgi:hypothetical protein